MTWSYRIAMTATTLLAGIVGLCTGAKLAAGHTQPGNAVIAGAVAFLISAAAGYVLVELALIPNRWRDSTTAYVLKSDIELIKQYLRRNA